MKKVSETEFDDPSFDQPPAEAPPHLRYVICSTQRSGSFMLCRLLYAAGIGIPTEYFHPQHAKTLSRRWKTFKAVRQQRVEPYYQQLLKQRTRNGIFGAKLQYWQIARWDDSACVRNFVLGSKVIFLFREDLLAQAVSLHFARISGKWGFDASVTTKAAGGEHFDRAAIDAAMKHLVREDTAWRMIMGRYSTPAYFVSYEALRNDPVAVTMSIAAFLGAPADPDVLQRYWNEYESVQETPEPGPSKKDVLAWYRQGSAETSDQPISVQLSPFQV